jgi:prepilin-type N-terminal cleavage/methylation domain-containing protein
MKNLPERRIPPSGFTLVELLVVISIIAILAGLIVYLLPGISEKKVRGRVKTELAVLVMAVNNYKAKLGFYPPDSPGSGTNALFYELTGTLRDTNAPYFIDKDDGRLLTNTIGDYFSTSGFLNSVNLQDPDPERRHNFLPTLKKGAYDTIPGSRDVRVLVVPYKGPGGDFNPWHYVASNPQHNPEGFDLWAEVVVGGKTIVIGNWKE